jgi:uncharacterized protein YfaS (alpha-2-macroglobulin family)
MIRIISFVLGLVLFYAGAGHAQGFGTTDNPVPEKRILISRDIDFFGADLRAVFDTTYQACEAACLSDESCRAFTFNTRSNSCFPKSEVTQRTQYQGAVSAEVVLTDARILAQATLRRAEIGFLTDADISAARDFAGAMARRYQPGASSRSELARAAQSALSRGQVSDAVQWSGAAITLGDAAADWSLYALATLSLQSPDQNVQRQAANRSLMAATNGYLRAVDAAERAAALEHLARALERTGRAGQMIPALRLAQQIAPTQARGALLDAAIAKYGFRVVDHRIESDAAAPRLCVIFSQALDRNVDYAPFVQLPGVNFSVQAQDRELCVDGVVHGNRYALTLRAGLPDAAAEPMARTSSLSLYVRDRAPLVRFPGRAYILPKALDAALPVVTVNVTQIDLVLRRISDRNLIRVMQENYFGRPLSIYEESAFVGDLAEEIWRGTGQVGSTLNADVTTRLPMGAVVADLDAGIYALQAKVQGADAYETPPATQWFVISDIGIATMQGSDGLHVIARSLASAEPKPDMTVTLLSRANAVLGTSVTDASGYARFDAGLALGRGAAAPALVTVEDGTRDIAFLSLTDPAFDLSDRGVEGRAASGPIDVFLTTDRGAYRAGEVIYATALVRDGRAKALSGLPVTAILRRPDGVEYSRHRSDSGMAGGHVFALPVVETAPRGTWTLALHADPTGPALASRTVLVEDFLPERIDFDLALPQTQVRLSDTPPLAVDVRYFFGAPGAGLRVEGEVMVRAANGLSDYPGYRFGRHDVPFASQLDVLAMATTDAAGAATVAVRFPEVQTPDRPLEARFTLRVAEGSGRPVERELVRALAPDGPMIGIRPLFDGVIPEGSEAVFRLIAANGAQARQDVAPMPVKWAVNRVETQYQWYSSYGNWNWEPVTRRTRIASGETRLDAAPVDIAVPVGWGSYELEVERTNGAYIASSVGFHAGWYAPADASGTPDTLDVSLDKPRYAPGETATLRVVPRMAGKALVTVMSNRLIDMKMVDVSAGENLISLPVTEEWGAGAYVVARVIRPMDQVGGRTPSRVLGLRHAGVETPDQRLSVAFEMASTAAPRAPVEVVLRVDGIAPGEDAFVTIAAVDQGILNLTGHHPPDPEGYFLGQRKLGMGLRDIYGRLIDGMNGAVGTLRSGGDAMASMRMQTAPPTEDLVAYFSGPLEVAPDGTVRTSFALPSFNGSVRFMAVAWSDSATGAADAEVLVRDPVVVTASLPRFMAPGDRGRMLLELTHAEGPTGDVRVVVAASQLVPVGLDQRVTLAKGASARLEVGLAPQTLGTQSIEVALTTPEGRVLIKTVTLAVQSNDAEVARTSRFDLAAGDTFSLSRDVFAGLVPGSGTATLALGALGRLNAPGLLETLDRYPYGCTEQTTSRALPLLYFDQLAIAMGGDKDTTIRLRVDQAIARVLSRQANSGGFGLWQAQSGDFWLDAYVTDFLSRAQVQGYDVPRIGFSMALDNLRNHVNYAPDFDAVSGGGDDIAYALLVLAREGAATMGDLRYYVDVKGAEFATPLASAQLGAALALYGDQLRADQMFARAAVQMASRMADDSNALWRADYGSNLRDAAAVLTLAVEAGTRVIDTETLARRLAVADGRAQSTQEAAWTLLAAHALTQAAPQSGFTVDGSVIKGPLVKLLKDLPDTAAIRVTNGSGRTTQVTLTTFGVPDEPVARGGNGYVIARQYYTTDGEAASAEGARVGTRLVVVLTITPFGQADARLMINDPLPAGFEIDNPNLLRSGDVRGLGVLNLADVQMAQFRDERFLAAVDWRSEQPFQLAYVVRAISPGVFHHPAASVEDMYRPRNRARTDAGRITVLE